MEMLVRKKHPISKIFLILPLLLIKSIPLMAQLSPGDLHQSHAEIEGLKNCTKCHTAGKQISPENCLTCHILLKERIDAGKGLHAQPDYKQCIDCHSDHHGRDFEMVHWKIDMEDFDHSLTGYHLEGGHAKLECRNCHQSENIQDKNRFRQQKKDLDRTFLGLSQTCLSCHIDEHRGQLKSDCLSCHIMNKWKPAPEFSHDRTNFRLTGKHTGVSCEKCHQTVTDNRFANDASFTKFTGIQFARCGDCHKDPHKGQFGNSCKTCHNTLGWRSTNLVNFDHNQTRFPLEGQHTSVKCEKCHKPGEPYRGLQFAKCMDCHSDFHEGQFAGRTEMGACEECHTVHGFAPSTFTIEQHNQSDFSLTGAHLAIPCFVCHQGNPGDREIHRDQPSMLKINRFEFAAFNCRDCHQDIHRGQFDLKSAANGEVLRLTECSKCHITDNWLADKFDHDRDSQFKLEGAHQGVACQECHKKIEKGGIVFVKYKPLEMTCNSCHSDGGDRKRG